MCISKYECDYHFVSECIYKKFIFTKEYLKLKYTTSNPPKKNVVDRASNVVDRANNVVDPASNVVDRANNVVNHARRV